jgi:hypothetical protein
MEERWKHNRFEAYKGNTVATATRSLPPGTNGTAAALQMLKDIERDKDRVITLCHKHCAELWLEAAKVCELTYECPATPGRRLVCHKTNDIGLAWKQDGGPINAKRIAFIFHYYGTEVYRRAMGTAHQDAATANILATLCVVMDVQPAEMKHGQKTCVQQMYSNTANVKKHNILRPGTWKHEVRVNLEKGKVRGTDRTHRNWRRPKDVFFMNRPDPYDPPNHEIEKVSVTCCLVICLS